MSRETRSGVARDERGAILVIGAFAAIFLVGLLAYGVELGRAALYRETLQDAADAAALSSAVMHARGMNVLVLLNMVMAALLAVLVALRVVQSLAAIGAAAAALAGTVGSVVGVGAPLLGFVPVLQQVEASAGRSYEALRPPIMTALSVLHTTARAVRVVVPFTAQAAALDDVVSEYAPPASFGFVMPRRFTLPVEDDSFAVLCQRSGSFAAEVVLMPFEKGLPDALTGVIQDAAGELTGSASAWFCGEGGAKPPSVKRRMAEERPVLQGRRRCIEASSNPKATEQEVQVACAQVGEGSPDEQRRAALVQCDPRQERELSGFAWEERKVSVEYRQVQGAWVEVARHAEPAHRVQRGGSSVEHPCGDADALYAPEYDSSGKRRAAGEPPLVCMSEPEVVGGTPGGERREHIEVLHIVGCRKAVTVEVGGERVFGKDDAKSSGLASSARAPQRVEQGLELGSEDFQLRSIVYGKPPSGVRRVAVAARGEHAAAPVTEALGALSSLAVAQSEYFFDGDEPRGDWMWSMRWRARLRRFRLADPSGSSPADAERRSVRATDASDVSDVAEWLGVTPPSTADAACRLRAAATQGDPEQCRTTTVVLGTLAELVVH